LRPEVRKIRIWWTTLSDYQAIKPSIFVNVNNAVCSSGKASLYSWSYLPKFVASKAPLAIALALLVVEFVFGKVEFGIGIVPLKLFAFLLLPPPGGVVLFNKN
jgi:hypothetical protein